MPAAGELEAERLPELVSAMRDALETLRYRWLGPPIGGPDATLRGQWAAIVVSVVVVFACFFVLGRHTRGSAPPGGGAPVQLEGASGRAAIPAELSGGSPIAGAVPVAIVAKPRPRASTQPASTQPLPAEVAPTPTATTTTVAPEAAPAVTPTAASAPTAASTPSGGSSGNGTSGGGSSGGSGASGGRSSAGAGGSSSGSGSFDSSE